MQTPSFSMFVNDVASTVIAVAVYSLAIVISRYLLKRLYREEATKILYVVFILLTAVFLGYLAYIWRLFEFVVGFLATAGALGLLLALALVPWVSDIFAGISIALDPRINIGSEVEIDGKRGKIIEITLTRAIISGDECLIIVPNRKFRDSVVVLYSTKGYSKGMSL